MEALRAIAILPGPRSGSTAGAATGLAVKIEDGDGYDRGTWAASIEALRQAGVLDGQALRVLARYHTPAIARSARAGRCRGGGRVRARAGRRADRLTPRRRVRPRARDAPERKCATLRPMTADRDPYATLGLPRTASPRRGQAGVPPAGQGQPPGCRRRGGPAALPRDPGGLRPDRRTAEWREPRDRRERRPGRSRGQSAVQCRPDSGAGDASGVRRPEPPDSRLEWPVGHRVGHDGYRARRDRDERHRRRWRDRSGRRIASRCERLGRAGRREPSREPVARPAPTARAAGPGGVADRLVRRAAVAGPTRRRSARPRTTAPRRSRSSPTGAAPRGTARPPARTGRSTPRSTPTRASTAPSTRPGRDAVVAPTRRVPPTAARDGHRRRAESLRRRRAVGRTRGRVDAVPRSRRPDTATSWWQSTPSDADEPRSRGRGAGDRASGRDRAGGGAAAGAAAWTADDRHRRPGRPRRPPRERRLRSAAGPGGRRPRPSATGSRAATRASSGASAAPSSAGRRSPWRSAGSPARSTGCARFSATCDTSVAPRRLDRCSSWRLLSCWSSPRRLATIATIATAVTLAAAVPGALILSATGGATDVASGRAALGGLLVIAWVAGIGVGVWREWRRRGSAAGPSPPTNASGGPGPVS